MFSGVVPQECAEIDLYTAGMGPLSAEIDAQVHALMPTPTESCRLTDTAGMRRDSSLQRRDRSILRRDRYLLTGSTVMILAAVK